jgi:hypothetical protein
MKTMALMCAAVMAMAAGGFGMHKAGWFATQHGCRNEARHQVKAGDPLHSDAAMRFRTCQNTNWRVAMTVR